MSQSSSVIPIARSIARAGARSGPSVTSVDRGFIGFAMTEGYARPPMADHHSAAANTVVEGTGLTRRFGRTTALDGATFTVAAGVTGLLGANGAGKTTLLGLMLGLHRPDAGTLAVLGLDPTRAGPAVRARIGYSPEHHRLPPDTRAHDFVRHLAEIHGLPRRDATNRASDALWSVGLGEERFRPVGTMSTGQRQRVKLAQAIAHDPDLVLLDEPTDGLDPVQRDDMLALIRRIGTEFGIHVVVSSHLLDEVERICDAVVILREGRVVASGSMRELTGQGRGVLVEVDGEVAEVGRLLAAEGSTSRWRASASPCSTSPDLPGRRHPRPRARRGRRRRRRHPPPQRPHGVPGGRVPRGRRVSTAEPDAGGARILDRGYRRYDGPRTGTSAPSAPSSCTRCNGPSA